MINCRYPWLLGLLFAGLLAAASIAEAHRVSVFAWVEGDTIHTQSKFSGGKPVVGGQINVLDPTGNPLLQGTTDDNGRFAFAIPQKTDLTVEVVAGMGHRNIWRIKADELGAIAPSEVAGAPAKQGDPKTPPPAATVPETTQLTAAAQIEQIVARVVDQKIAPLNQRLAELQDQEPGLGEIVGGIGYIIGLIGVGAYVHYRRRVKELDRS